jgi:hypothetical protein
LTFFIFSGTIDKEKQRRTLMVKIHSNSNYKTDLNFEDRKNIQKFEKLFKTNKRVKLFSNIFFAIALFAILFGLFVEYKPVQLFILGLVNSPRGYLIFPGAKDSFPLIPFLSSLTGIVTVRLTLKLFFEKKLPTSLTASEEKALQVYLLRNEKEFEIEKVNNFGEVFSYREVGGQKEVTFKFDNQEEITLPVARKTDTYFDSVSEEIVGTSVLRRTVLTHYPKIGILVASDKIIVPKQKDVFVSKTSKRLNPDEIKMLVRVDKSTGTHYEVRVNED